MKIQLLTLMVIAITSSPITVAEGDRHQGGKQGDGGRRAAHMQEQFGVTDDQLSQMREIRENGGGREEVRAVLTDDQRSQMQQWRQENPQGSKGGKSPRDQSNGEEE
jgi:Spy/CpxP family protein refolding chaperone